MRQEAEPVLRECLDRALKNPAEDLTVALAKGSLGECLIVQNRFADAEPMVVQSYESLRTSKGGENPFTLPALKRVVELYEKWQKPELATKYRALS